MLLIIGINSRASPKHTRLMHLLLICISVRTKVGWGWFLLLIRLERQVSIPPIWDCNILTALNWAITGNSFRECNLRLVKNALTEANLFSLMDPPEVLITGTNTISVGWEKPGVQSVSISYIFISGCSSTDQVVVPVTVNPSPIVIVFPLIQEICSGTFATIKLTPSDGTVTYSWSAETIS